MGLLNNWLQKKKKEQLNKATARAGQAGVKAKQVEVAQSKKSIKDDAKKETKHKVKLSEKSAAYKVLLKPLVTEKSAVAESSSKYSFVVARSANKNQIKLAITEIYGVKPIRVNVANVEGRWVRFGRATGRRRDCKKAIVTLPAGKTIDIHSGV